jgi:hypothetical protein
MEVQSVNKQLLLVIGLFIVAMGSGILVGMNIHRPQGEGPHERSWLADELQLSPQQRDQMRAIWSEVLRGPGGGPNAGPGGRHGDSRRQLYVQRDEAIAALISPEQKPAYDKVIERFNTQMAQMDHERDAAFQKAVEKTKAILAPAQREKYEQILARGPMGPPWRRSSTGPASRPAPE